MPAASLKDSRLRIFSDAEGRFNLSLLDTPARHW